VKSAVYSRWIRSSVKSGIDQNFKDTWMADLDAPVEADNKSDKDGEDDEVDGLGRHLHLVGKVVQDVFRWAVHGHYTMVYTIYDSTTVCGGFNELDVS